MVKMTATAVITRRGEPVLFFIVPSLCFLLKIRNVIAQPYSGTRTACAGNVGCGLLGLCGRPRVHGVPIQHAESDVGYRQQQGRSLSREPAAVKRKLRRVNDYLQRFYRRVNVYLVAGTVCLIAVKCLKW
jgi:hypothetical protein